jgi:putative FmdB family regulatory protein
MPIYEYRCENGHTFEALQSMSDDPVSSCEQCGAPVERVFHPVAVRFKGSGFYSTDYAGKSKEAASAQGASSSGSSKEGKSEAKRGSKDDSKGSGSGAANKAGSSSD